MWEGLSTGGLRPGAKRADGSRYQGDICRSGVREPGGHVAVCSEPTCCFAEDLRGLSSQSCL